MHFLQMRRSAENRLIYRRDEDRPRRERKYVASLYVLVFASKWYAPPNLSNTVMAPVAQSAIANLKKAGLSDIVYVPGEQAYEAREESYWSLTPRLHPWAIVQPRNTDEVSKAVKALVKTPGCNFAIRRLVPRC